MKHLRNSFFNFLRSKTSRLTPIPGLMPDPTNLPEGCNFAPRCARATELCFGVEPEQREIGAGHFVACHFPLGGPAHEEEARS